jgi:hypothetical protein
MDQRDQKDWEQLLGKLAHDIRGGVVLAQPLIEAPSGDPSLRRLAHKGEAWLVLLAHVLDHSRGESFSTLHARLQTLQNQVKAARTAEELAEMSARIKFDLK